MDPPVSETWATPRADCASTSATTSRAAAASASDCRSRCTTTGGRGHPDASLASLSLRAAASLTCAASSAFGGIGMASTMALLPLARAARRSRRAVRSASATDGARPARMASLADCFEMLTCEADGERLLVDLVGVEPAQLVGEALGVAAVGERDGAHRLAGLGERRRVAVVRPDEVDRAAGPLQAHRDDAAAVARSGEGHRAAQPRGQPPGEQLARRGVRRGDDGRRRDRLVGGWSSAAASSPRHRVTRDQARSAVAVAYPSASRLSTVRGAVGDRAASVTLRCAMTPMGSSDGVFGPWSATTRRWGSRRAAAG